MPTSQQTPVRTNIWHSRASINDGQYSNSSFSLKGVPDSAISLSVSAIRRQNQCMMSEPPSKPSSAAVIWRCDIMKLIFYKIRLLWRAWGLSPVWIRLRCDWAAKRWIKAAGVWPISWLSKVLLNSCVYGLNVLWLLGPITSKIGARKVPTGRAWTPLTTAAVISSSDDDSDSGIPEFSIIR